MRRAASKMIGAASECVMQPAHVSCSQQKCRAASKSVVVQPAKCDVQPANVSCSQQNTSCSQQMFRAASKCESRARPKKLPMKTKRKYIPLLSEF
jgi:hypothetical protein